MHEKITYQFLKLQFLQGHGELCAHARLVQLDGAAQPHKLDHLHVVDQGVAVGPRVRARAVQGSLHNL